MEPSKGAIDESCAFTGLYARRLVSYANSVVSPAACLPLWNFSVIVVAGLRLNTVYVNHNTLDFTCKRSDPYHRQLANIGYQTIMLILLYGQPLRPTLELLVLVFQPCILCSKHSPIVASMRMGPSPVDEAAAGASKNQERTGNTHTKRRQHGFHGPEEPLIPPPPHLASTSQFLSMIEAPSAAFMRSRLWKRRVRGDMTRDDGNDFPRLGKRFYMFQRWPYVDRIQSI